MIKDTDDDQPVEGMLRARCVGRGVERPRPLQARVLPVPPRVRPRSSPNLYGGFLGLAWWVIISIFSPSPFSGVWGWGRKFQPNPSVVFVVTSPHPGAHLESPC